MHLYLYTNIFELQTQENAFFLKLLLLMHLYLDCHLEVFLRYLTDIKWNEGENAQAPEKSLNMSYVRDLTRDNYFTK